MNESSMTKMLKCDNSNTPTAVSIAAQSLCWGLQLLLLYRVLESSQTNNTLKAYCCCDSAVIS